MKACEFSCITAAIEERALARHSDIGNEKQTW